MPVICCYIDASTFASMDVTLQNFTVSGCRFKSVGGHCLTSNYYKCGEGGRVTSSAILLRNNQFHCSHKCVQLAWPRCNATSVTLSRNSFLRNKFYAAVELYLLNVPFIRVTENTFVDLRGGALSLSLADAADSEVTISDNIFRAVGSPYVDSAVSIDCRSGSRRSARDVLNISLSRNDFFFNLASSAVVTSCPGLFVTENVFVNPGAARDFETRVLYENFAMMFAPLNHWNATTFDAIAARVYDFADDESVALVQVSPWYLDPNRTQMASGGSQFFKGPFEVGGRMESDVTLSSTEQPYRVTQNIFVPHGRKLVIEAGVELLFASGGITVEGKYTCSVFYNFN